MNIEEFFIMGRRVKYWKRRKVLKGIGVEYPWELLCAMDRLLNSQHFDNFIHPDSDIAKDVKIIGAIHVGRGSKIKRGTVIEGPCYIGDNCEIGHYNVLRGPLNIENDVKTGAYTEVKHCAVQKDTHTHSGYFGDSVIGESCRFGAGFVTANRRVDRGSISVVLNDEKVDTGLTYLGAIIKNHVKFGIHCGTMPGVVVGDGSMIGPATHVFKSLGDGATLYAKFENALKYE